MHARDGAAAADEDLAQLPHLARRILERVAAEAESLVHRHVGRRRQVGNASRDLIDRRVPQARVRLEQVPAIHVEERQLLRRSLHLLGVPHVLAQRALRYQRRVAAVLVEDRRALLAKDRLIALLLAEPPPAPLARRPSRSRSGQHERRLAVPRTPVRRPRHGQRSGQQRGAKVGLRSCSLEGGLAAKPRREEALEVRRLRRPQRPSQPPHPPGPARGPGSASGSGGGGGARRFGVDER
mmetsp:Transcript_33025/g.103876  ORF Transcript_33025/g.103876 Transcript_33025/m.103876 type:complete len:239 (+) Transcript_33025:670-1386(+)